MLKIDELRVNYGGIEAVKGITFQVPERKIVTLIGANGAGKSTTLRTIAGLVKPASGRIHLQGDDITALSPDRIVSKGITLVPEGRRVFPDLTVVENLKIGAYLRKDDLEDDLKWVYDLFPRLKERSWQASICWPSTSFILLVRWRIFVTYSCRCSAPMSSRTSSSA